MNIVESDRFGVALLLLSVCLVPGGRSGGFPSFHNSAALYFAALSSAVCVPFLQLLLSDSAGSYVRSALWLWRWLCRLCGSVGSVALALARSSRVVSVGASASAVRFLCCCAADL